MAVDKVYPHWSAAFFCYISYRTDTPERPMRTLVVIFSLLLIQSCSSATKNEEDFEEANTFSLEAEDANVKIAKDSAQHNLLFYINQFRTYSSNQNYSFSLKKPYVEADETEHMWARPIRVDSTGFTCILDNEPRLVTNYQFGDTVLVNFDDIEDLIMVKNDTLIMGTFLQTIIEAKWNR